MAEKRRGAPTKQAKKPSAAAKEKAARKAAARAQGQSGSTPPSPA
jgi:hypothetical protein